MLTDIFGITAVGFFIASVVRTAGDAVFSRLAGGRKCTRRFKRNKKEEEKNIVA